MLNFDVNFGHVALVALANFFSSWIWYSHALFARPWMKALGKNPNRGMQDMTKAEKKMMPFLFLGGAAASLLLAWVLAVLVASLGAQDFAAGAKLGLLCWLGFALTGTLNTLWEGKKPLVLVINNGLYILTYALFGGILAAWK